MKRPHAGPVCGKEGAVPVVGDDDLVGWHVLAGADLAVVCQQLHSEFGQGDQDRVVSDGDRVIHGDLSDAPGRPR